MRELPEGLKAAIDDSVVDVQAMLGAQGFANFVLRVGPATIVTKLVAMGQTLERQEIADQMEEFRPELEAYLAGLAGMC